MNVNDRILGGLMLVLAVAYGWGATQIPVPFGGSEAVGPATFPKILAAVLLICSLYLLVKPDADNPWPWGRTLLELVGAVAVLVGYTLLLEPIGFILATALAVSALCVRLGARLVPAFMSGLIGGVAVFVLFNYGLELPLPLGFWEAS